MSSFPLGRAGMQARVQGADATLAEIVRRLVDAYSPLRIHLFGSKARGDPSLAFRAPLPGGGVTVRLWMGAIAGMA